MKEFYEKNKKLVMAVAAVLCLLLCVGAVVGIRYAAGSGENTQAKESVRTVTASKQKAVEKEQEEDTQENAAEPEPVTEEAVVVEEATQEAAEIVEDSVLDIVETPAPAETAAPAPTEAAAPQPQAAAPAADLSNMAQNVAFPYEIHVNKLMNCVTVYAMDTSGAYSIPYKAMVCSTGNATPLGTFQTPAKYIWKILKGNVWGQYSTRVTGSILFHSVPYRTSSKDALISKYYNKLGTTASAGCIRLTTIDAKWIYDNCPLGTTVIIYNDSNPGPLGKPTAMKVPESNKWDPTDPDPSNPWAGRVLRIDGVQNQYIERGSGYDAMAGVSATDGSGSNVTGNIQVSTNADIYTAGIYGVHYTVTDSMGNTASADATLTVVDTQAPVFAGVPARIEGKRYWEVTRDLLMSGVSVSDNGLPFAGEWVDVQIPAITDGENQIIYRATDASGNTSYASSIVVCDSTAPVITKRGDAVDVLACDMAMDEQTALGRIQVQDANPVSTTCQIVPADWGYRIDYTATDSYGNISVFSDNVSYVTYEFEEKAPAAAGEADLRGTMVLKDSTGHTMELPANVTVSPRLDADGNGTVVYSYTYSCPLGSRTAEYTRVVGK